MPSAADLSEVTRELAPKTRDSIAQRGHRERVGHRLTRRRLLRGVLAGGALSVVGLGGYAWRIEPTWPELIERTMPIPDLPGALAGFRIVHLSDLHVGPDVPMAYLGKWVEAVSAREPDLVAVTGDLVHQGRSAWTGPAARLLGRLRAREGVVAVLGNHDWGTCTMGGGRAAWADGIAAAVAAEGIRVPRNEALAITRGSATLHIVGLDDCWGNRFDPAAAFAAVPAATPCIALSHNPDTFVELLNTSASWTLAGHTHGGQVCIPVLGPPILPVRHKEFVAGHYQVGDKHLYVNRGLGWLKRIRFNARPEITEFTLERA